MITLSVQTAVVAIMATGMVLVIVSRNIDLSVGSIVGVVAMAYALLMTDWLPHGLGLGANNPLIWILALVIGLALGAAIGAFEGFIIAYIGVPSFIVTLGRAARAARRRSGSCPAARPSQGSTTPSTCSAGAPRDPSAGMPPGCWPSSAVSQRSGCSCTTGGNVDGSASPCVPCGRMCSWAWSAAAAILGIAAIANANYWPKGLAAKYAQQHGIVVPPGGLQISTGFPWPIIVIIAVTLLMTFIATRRRFGRYVYAYGGNPDAAELAGINTRWTIMKIYMLMGLLCAVSPLRSPSHARTAPRSTWAPVTSCTSSPPRSLAAPPSPAASAPSRVPSWARSSCSPSPTGWHSSGVNTPTQNIVAGAVLIVAVGLDSYNRRRGGGR